MRATYTKRGQMEAGQTGPPRPTTGCFSDSFIYKTITVAGLLISIKFKTQAYSLDIQLCSFPELMLVLEGKLFYLRCSLVFLWKYSFFKSHLNYSYKCFTQFQVKINSQRHFLSCHWIPSFIHETMWSPTLPGLKVRARFRPIGFLWQLQVWFRWACSFENTNGGSSKRFAAMEWVVSGLESVFVSRKESSEQHWRLFLMEKMVLFLLGMSLIYQLAPLTKRSRTVDPIGWS